MTTRFQADVDLITIPGCHCHVSIRPTTPRRSFDPRARLSPARPSSTARFRFNLKKNFIRSQFMEIDQDKWAKEIAF